MRRKRCPHILALLPVLLGTRGPTVRAAPAAWPMFRHDQGLTCRSEGSGGLAAPRVAWSYDLRGWQVQLSVQSDDGSVGETEVGPFDAPRGLSVDEVAAWGLGAPLVDLHGDGKLVPAPAYAADILPDVPGLETPGTVMEDNERGWCVLYAHDGPEPREVWRSQQFRVYQGPHPIVADANGDGQLDVIACPHYQIVVMDGRTGEVIEQLRWHDGRNYGHFIAKNIDDDPALEFLVLADFYTHMDLIDNDGRNLKLAWRKEIELKIENKQKILRPRWDSLQDLNGDGRFEVVTNLYNDTGDRQWHLMIYDALAGDTVLDLPGTFMTGLADIEGDGRVELFCTDTEALFEPTSARLSILNLAGGRAVTRWTYPRGAWATVTQRYPLYINSLVAHADRNVVLHDLGERGHALYVTEPAQGRDGCALKRFIISPTGIVSPSWTLVAPGRSIEVLGSRSTDEGAADALVSIDGGLGTGGALLAYRRCVPEAVAWTQALPERARWGNLIAADLDGQGTPTVVAVAANSRVVAIVPPESGTEGQQAPTRWSRTGAGTIAAADLNGDGAGEVAMLGWEPSGEGNVTVVGGSGTTLWSAGIAGFPGPMEPWNFSALTTLGVGRLAGAPHADVVVFSRRSTMHSDEGHALRGTDGTPLWDREGSFDGEHTWGFGGTPVALVDTNDDGCNDIVSLYPVNLTVVSGKDGDQLVGRSAAGDSIFPGIWAAYALPTVFDYEGDGRPDLTWNGGYCLGLTDLAGDTRWAITPAAEGFPVDADGDGRYEMASVLDTTLRWLDPATGEVRWTLDLPATSAGMAIADVDGDGTEETVVACGTQLAAAHVQDGAPAILWQLEAPAQVQEFILADTGADGGLEAVVYGADGRLYGIDG